MLDARGLQGIDKVTSRVREQRTEAGLDAEDKRRGVAGDWTKDHVQLVSIYHHGMNE